MDNLQNLEERCEDAVFKVCDARERFSRKCAEGLDNYLFLETRLVIRWPNEYFILETNVLKTMTWRVTQSFIGCLPQCD
ncbi:uncharacterized protein LOC124186088 isoform X2 [Neodiprion fabricii]|uniref:uncharacterized protein LOC124186088 isoform X2 n=1 Tax=Neodiprion fabricii TaxID=2872261 RepID=UPI001ED972B7|nr:uncharacterized protein LOC124186088 isoform X2 [Neodiprion fabricii]